MQASVLAHLAGRKLCTEAARSDQQLRLLVCHANFLDTLTVEICRAEHEQFFESMGITIKGMGIAPCEDDLEPLHFNSEDEDEAEDENEDEQEEGEENNDDEVSNADSEPDFEELTTEYDVNETISPTSECQRAIFNFEQDDEKETRFGTVSPLPARSTFETCRARMLQVTHATLVCKNSSRTPSIYASDDRLPRKPSNQFRAQPTLVATC